MRRVLVISATDGWSVAVFAGLCAVLSLLFGEWLGFGIGATIAGAGAMELHGRRKLINGEANGMSFLIRAQLIILLAIWLYAFGRLLTYDETAILTRITPEARELIFRLYGITVAELQPLIRPMYFAFYLIVVGATLLFQGGLALYYRTRKSAVRAALEKARATPPPLPQE